VPVASLESSLSSGGLLFEEDIMETKTVQETHWIVHSSQKLGPAIEVHVDATYKICDDGGTSVEYSNVDYVCWGNA